MCICYVDSSKQNGSSCKLINRSQLTNRKTMTIFVIIHLTKLVNKFITKSNKCRVVNQIERRLAAITCQNRTVMSSYQTHTYRQLALVWLVPAAAYQYNHCTIGTSCSVPTEPVYRLNKTAILSFPDVCVTCHVSRVSISRHLSVCLSGSFLLLCRFCFRIGENQIKIRLLAQAPTDVSSNSLASHVAIVINICTVCEHKYRALFT